MNALPWLMTIAWLAWTGPASAQAPGAGTLPVAACLEPSVGGAPIANAVPKRWPALNGAVVVRYTLDPNMPAGAQADFHEVAVQLSNVAGSAIEGGVAFTFEHVPGAWDAALMDSSCFALTPAVIQPGPVLSGGWAWTADPVNQGAAVDLAVRWYDPSSVSARTRCADPVANRNRTKLNLGMQNYSVATGGVLAQTTTGGAFDGFFLVPPEATCDASGAVLMAFNSGVPWAFGDESLPSYLGPPEEASAISFKQTALHELHHAALFNLHTDYHQWRPSDFTGDALSTLQGAVLKGLSILETTYPHGGDPGGSDDAAPPNPTGTPHIGPEAFTWMRERYPAGAGVRNLLLYKWGPGFGPGGLRATERWTMDDGPDWAWSIAYTNYGAIEYPVPPDVEAGFVSADASADVRVEWFATEPGADCAAGLPLAFKSSNTGRARTETVGYPPWGIIDSWTAYVGSVEFTLPSDVRYRVPEPNFMASCDVPPGTYRLCATISFADGTADANPDDNTVYSDRAFVVHDADANDTRCDP